MKRRIILLEASAKMLCYGRPRFCSYRVLATPDKRFLTHHREKKTAPAPRDRHLQELQDDIKESMQQFLCCPQFWLASF